MTQTNTERRICEDIGRWRPYASQGIVVQSTSHVWLFVTPWTAAHQPSVSFTTSWSLLKLMSIESVLLSNHLILCCSLFLLSSIFPSIKVFFSESAVRIRWPKYWSFNFNIHPSKEYSGLTSFEIGWFDLAFQGTLKSLRQHHSSKASIFWRSAFFNVQLSHPYMTTGKTIALTIQTFVSKVISLLFNMLCRFVKAFLPRSNCLLISWLQSPSTVILEPKKRKSVTSSTFCRSVCHEVMRPDHKILVFLISTFKPAFSLSSFALIKGPLKFLFTFCP